MRLLVLTENISVPICLLTFSLLWAWLPSHRHLTTTSGKASFHTRSRWRIATLWRQETQKPSKDSSRYQLKRWSWLSSISGHMEAPSGSLTVGRPTEWDSAAHGPPATKSTCSQLKSQWVKEKRSPPLSPHSSCESIPKRIKINILRASESIRAHVLRNQLTSQNKRHRHLLLQ